MSEPIKVLIADDMSKKAVDLLSQAGFQVDVKTGMKPEELAAVVGQYHGLGVRSASKVTAAVLANPGKLKIIGRAGVGVDNIDVKAANEKGILVINTPQGNAAAAAELAIGLMFALARKIPGADASMKRGEWEKKKFMGVEIAGKTLGVVGLGNIGRNAASRGVGLGMKVLGFDPHPPKELPAGVTLASLDDVITKSDFITLHVPLVESTKNLFNAQTFAKMKKGSYPSTARAAASSTRAPCCRRSSPVSSRARRSTSSARSLPRRRRFSSTTTSSSRLTSARRRRRRRRRSPSSWPRSSSASSRTASSRTR
jgi:D-3-phosphoglycerate dehydrogenase